MGEIVNPSYTSHTHTHHTYTHSLIINNLISFAAAHSRPWPSIYQTQLCTYMYSSVLQPGLRKPSTLSRHSPLSIRPAQILPYVEYDWTTHLTYGDLNKKKAVQPDAWKKHADRSWVHHLPTDGIRNPIPRKGHDPRKPLSMSRLDVRRHGCVGGWDSLLLTLQTYSLDRGKELRRRSLSSVSRIPVRQTFHHRRPLRPASPRPQRNTKASRSSLGRETLLAGTLPEPAPLLRKEGDSMARPVGARLARAMEWVLLPIRHVLHLGTIVHTWFPFSAFTLVC